MPAPKLYEFEGGQYSALDIRQMMPIYSERTIRDYLAESPQPKTKADMHAIAARRAANSRISGKRNAQAVKHTNHRIFAKKGKPE